VELLGSLQRNYFDKNEVNEVLQNFIDLKCSSASSVEGYIEFHASYNNIRIQDRYHIKITKGNPHSEYLPALYEMGGRTFEIANDFHIKDTRDLHKNTDGTACVCTKQVEKLKWPPGSTLNQYIENLVIPYLYALSFYSINGFWPWGDLLHGACGLLQYYNSPELESDIDEIVGVFMAIRKDLNWKEVFRHLKKPNPDYLCLCGSKRKISECHFDVYNGIHVLHERSIMLQINLKAIGNPTYLTGLLQKQTSNET